MKKLLSLATLTVLFSVSFGLTWMKPGSANDDAKIEARIAAWGRNCKNAVVSHMGSDVSMSDINVTLGATLQSSIDAGEITLKEINRDGLSYNWSVQKKKVSGYCDTDGKGNVTEFKLN